MMKIDEIAAALETNFGAVFLSPVAPGPGDVDLCVKREKFDEVGEFLAKSGFVLFQQNRYQRIFCGYFDGAGYMFDVVCNFAVYSRYSVGVELSAVGESTLLTTPELYKTLKYICQRRVSMAKYVARNQSALAQFLSCRQNTTWISPPFLRSLDGPPGELFDAIHRSYSLPQFLPRFVRNRLLTPLRELNLKRRGGKTIAFIGPDGSGKSFFIEKLKQIGINDVMYMGDWFFVLQPLYNRLLGIPSPYNRFIYVFYLLENIVRQIRVSIARAGGHVVLLDRFPGTNRNAVHAGFLGTLNRAIFRLFPKPDVIVLLHARPEVVFARKQELSVSEIGALQEALRKAIAGHRHIILDTEQLDSALNELLLNIAAPKSMVRSTESGPSLWSRRLMKFRSRTLLFISAGTYLLSKGIRQLRKSSIGKTRVIVFHHLDEPAIFSRIIAGVCRRYNVVSFQDYLEGRTDPDRVNVIFAFDDGYVSWHENGLPLFKKHGVYPLLYVNSDFVEISEVEAYKYCQTNIKTRPERSIGWDQLARLVDHGAELGGHGAGHIDLSVPVASIVLREAISLDRETIYRKMGEMPRVFAYPFGRFNETASEQVAAAGYSYGFSSNSGFLEDSVSNLQLNRSNVGMRSNVIVFAVIEGYSDLVSAAFRKIKRMVLS